MATTARTRRKDTTGATESTTPEPTAPDATEATPNGDTSTPAPEPTAPDASEATPNGESDAPAAPATPATNARDRMKVTLVGEILGEHPDGIPAVDLVTASELQPAVVARVLTAMEATGAAYRKVADSGTETWYRGGADLAEVNLATAPADSVCPMCKRGGWRVNVGGTGGTRRRNGNGNGEPRVNADGNTPLRKGELTGMVRDFLSARPGKPYSDSDIARELREIHSRPSISSGAVRENLTKMIIDKQVPVELANPTDSHDRRVMWAA
jgi:hypothetical protein